MSAALDKQYASLTVLTIATAVVAWCVQPYLVGVFHDDGVYALLAKSIASGQGFHYVTLPGTPAAIHYPPLYPILLAGIWRIWSTFPDNVTALVVINAPLAGLAAYGWWYFATQRLDWCSWWTVPAALAATLTMPTLALANALLSETLFLALLWPALVLSEQAATRNRSPVVAGVLIGILMLVRTHAIALLVALVLVFAWDRRWRDAAMAFACAAALQAPWILWSALAAPRVSAPLAGSYGSYLGWFAQGAREGGASFLLATVAANARECWLYTSDRFAAGFPAPIHYLALALVVAALVAGVVALGARGRVTTMFLACYFAITLVWPYNPWRFVWAVWPLVLLLAFAGVVFAFTRLPRLRAVVAVAALLPAVAMVRVEQHSFATEGWLIPARAATQQIAPVIGWVRARTAPSDVILTEGEPAVALFTGRRSAPPVAFTAREYLVPPTITDGKARLTDMLHTIPAQWVILFSPTTIQAADDLRGHPGLARFQALRTAVVYRVTP